MSTVLAAIDNSPTAEPVLVAAVVLSNGIGAEVRALHVANVEPASVRERARKAGVPLQTMPGRPAATICDAIEDEDVLLGVLGIRREPETRRPVGSIAGQVCETSHKPVVVVPPTLRWQVGESIDRALVPLDGTDASSRSVRRAWRLLKGSGVDLVALHVFDPQSVPRFWDVTRNDFEAWSQEFLARHAETATELEIRSGRAADQVLEVGRASKVDLIVLEWSQSLKPGRAAVLREVLSRTETPVLLLPVEEI